MTVDTYKVLGQLDTLAAGGAGDVYTVPGSTTAIVSALVVTNRDSIENAIQVTVTPSGGSPSVIRNQQLVPPNGMHILVEGLTLGAGDKISVACDGAALLTVQAFGVEKTAITSITPKILGTHRSVAATAFDLYTVPAARSAVISTIIACHVGHLPNPNALIRLQVAVAGAASAVKQYLAFDYVLVVPFNTEPASNPVSGDDSHLDLTLGLTLATTDVVRCQADTASVDFTLFGVEIA